MTAQLEYVLTALLEYKTQIFKRAHVSAAHPSLKDELNCAVLLLLAARCSQTK